MEVTKRRLLSRPKPEPVQEKTMKSVHRVLKERRLLLSQICAQGETEALPKKSGLKPTTESAHNKPMNSVNEVQKENKVEKSGLKPTTESAQNKPMNSVNGVQKKRRLTMILVQAQEKPQKNPHLAKKLDCIEKRATFIDVAAKKARLRNTRNRSGKKINTEKPATFIVGAVKKMEILTETGNQQGKKINTQKLITSIDGALKWARLTETGNQQGKKINTEISLNSTGDEENDRALCNWRKTKIDRERQKQREAARLALEQVKSTCGLQDNMDSMRDFEKLVGCSSAFYIFSRDRKYCHD